MASDLTPPSINATAFDCPHCGAYTTQYWFEVYAKRVGRDQRTPSIPDETMKQEVATWDLDDHQKAGALRYIERMQEGLVFIEPHKDGTYLHDELHNLYVSHCFNCDKMAVWVHKSLVFPPQRAGEEPNADLPPDVIRDVEEARAILNLSPRGAAALLRLSVQKVCAFLGEKGKNIDEDIASLVSKGLNPLVQKSLDVVRVIGNEAVHPGVLDLRDDRDTAVQLLRLVNLIAAQMISHPKEIHAMYEALPPEKRAAIEARNARAASTSTRGTGGTTSTDS
jgi:hypothetical protein